MAQSQQDASVAPAPVAPTAAAPIPVAPTPDASAPAAPEVSTPTLFPSTPPGSPLFDVPQPPSAPVASAGQEAVTPPKDTTPAKRKSSAPRLSKQEVEQKLDALRNELLEQTEEPPEPDMFDRASNIIREIANYRLLSDPKDSTKPPLTVYDAVLAALVVFVGFFLSKRAAIWAHRAIERHPEIDENVATLVEHVLYYALAACFVIYGLQRVHVELTAFAFLGGAIAIGIGFGAQNLISNFISGLILLVEQPVKLNDLIEVDGECGRITVIGARCSQVRLGRGIDVVVPNSMLLDRKVVNWTLSDPRVRYSVRTGVVYGTVARDAAALLERAVLANTSVLKDPPPLVIFSEFGDTALIFEVFYWLDVSTGVDSRVVSSDIRFAVDELLREAGMLPAPLAVIRDAKPVQ